MADTALEGASESFWRMSRIPEPRLPELVLGKIRGGTGGTRLPGGRAAVRRGWRREVTESRWTTILFMMVTLCRKE